MARLTDVLSREHGALLALLNDCLTPSGGVNLQAFETYRRRQLRQVAIEEKVLLPALGRRVPLTAAFQNGLRKDHEAIVTLCVTTPVPDFVQDLRELLAWQQRVKEEAGGLFELYDRHVGDDPEVDRELARLPAIAVPPYVSGAAVSSLLHQVLRQLGIEREA